jgi:hypothetical protein
VCDPLEWNAHQALAAWTSRKCDPFSAGILSIARRQYSLPHRQLLAHLPRVNKLLRHTPKSCAVIEFTRGERIVISPSGIVIAKLWLGMLRRRLIE